MRSFDSKHYELIGFGPVSIQDTNVNMWILKTRPVPTISNFTESTVVVEEAKYVDNGNVYFLKSSGRIENNSRQIVETVAMKI
jgi:hypothetical protein